MTNRINAYQVVRILELHRRGNSASQIADLILGSRSGCADIARVLEAFGQTPCCQGQAQALAQNAPQKTAATGIALAAHAAGN